MNAIRRSYETEYHRNTTHIPAYKHHSPTLPTALHTTITPLTTSLPEYFIRTNSSHISPWGLRTRCAVCPA